MRLEKWGTCGMFGGVGVKYSTRTTLTDEVEVLSALNEKFDLQK